MSCLSNQPDFAKLEGFSGKVIRFTFIEMVVTSFLFGIACFVILSKTDENTFQSVVLFLGIYNLFVPEMLAMLLVYHAGKYYMGVVELVVSVALHSWAHVVLYQQRDAQDSLAKIIVTMIVAEYDVRGLILLFAVGCQYCSNKQRYLVVESVDEEHDYQEVI